MCARRQQPIKIREDQYTIDSLPLDIPTPVSVQLCGYKTSADGSLIYGFNAVKDMSFYKSFYERALPEVGWYQESLVSGHEEIVFVFKKPHKWCTLLIDKTKVRFFISTRISRF